jgi:hypothetical protein
MHHLFKILLVRLETHCYSSRFSLKFFFPGTLSAPNTPRSSKSSSWNLTQPTAFHHPPPQFISPGVSPTASPGNDGNLSPRIWTENQSPSTSTGTRSSPPPRAPPPAPMANTGSDHSPPRVSVSTIGIRSSRDLALNLHLIPTSSSTSVLQPSAPILPPKGNFVDFVAVLRSFWLDFENAFLKRRDELVDKSPQKPDEQSPALAGSKESALAKIFSRRFGASVRSASSSSSRPKIDTSEYKNLDPNLSPRGSGPSPRMPESRLRSLALLDPIKRVVLTSDPISIQKINPIATPTVNGYSTPEATVDLSDTESQTPRSSVVSRSRSRPRPIVLSESPFNNQNPKSSGELSTSITHASASAESAHLSPPAKISKRKSVGRRRRRNSSKSSAGSTPQSIAVDSPPPQIPCSSCVLALSPQIRDYIDHQVQREVNDRLKEIEAFWRIGAPNPSPSPLPRSSVDSSH